MPSHAFGNVQAGVLAQSLQQMAAASVGDMCNDLKLAENVNEATRNHIQALVTTLDDWAPLQAVGHCY